MIAFGTLGLVKTSTVLVRILPLNNITGISIATTVFCIVVGWTGAYQHSTFMDIKIAFIVWQGLDLTN
jgi:hypothetical protein